MTLLEEYINFFQIQLLARAAGYNKNRGDGSLWFAGTSELLIYHRYFEVMFHFSDNINNRLNLKFRRGSIIIY